MLLNQSNSGAADPSYSSNSTTSPICFAAATVGFKLQGFGVTLCRHRVSFRDLVNSLSKSILTDSKNRCFLPLVTYPW